MPVGCMRIKSKEADGRFRGGKGTLKIEEKKGEALVCGQF